MNSLTSSKIGSQSLRVLSILRTTLKLEDADVIQINRLGKVVTPLPEGLTAQDIDVAAVQSGQTTSGRKGNTVYAVAPVTLSAAGARAPAGADAPSHRLRGHVRHPVDP